MVHKILCLFGHVLKFDVPVGAVGVAEVRLCDVIKMSNGMAGLDREGEGKKIEVIANGKSKGNVDHECEGKRKSRGLGEAS